MKIVLGTKVTDETTGFKGFAVARCEYLNKEVDISVQPPVDDSGKWVEARWIPEYRLVVTP